MKNLSLFLFILLLFSCKNDVVFEKNYEIESLQWARTDEKTFELEIDDPKACYSVWLQFRHISGYPYQSLWIRLHNYIPGDSVRTKQYEIPIRGSQNQYLGEGAGDYWDYETCLEPEVHFDAAGKFKFAITQAMQADPVNFVNSIGLIIKKNKQCK